MQIHELKLDRLVIYVNHFTGVMGMFVKAEPSQTFPPQE
jgi:hypothetical protein